MNQKQRELKDKIQILKAELKEYTSDSLYCDNESYKQECKKQVIRISKEIADNQFQYELEESK